MTRLSGAHGAGM
jgi:hypothetical protein